MSADILDMAYINSLPQPFMVRLLGDKEFLWGVESIGVDAAFFQIDVCGRLQTMRFSDAREFMDASGVKHNADDFYLDSDRALTAQEATA